jgi:hypothetical protein
MCERFCHVVQMRKIEAERTDKWVKMIKHWDRYSNDEKVGDYKESINE